MSQAITRWFTNRFSSKIKNHRGTASIKAIPNDAEKSVRPKATHSLLSFTSEMTLREFFEDRVSDEDINTAVPVILKSYPDLKGGALWKKAVAHLWNNVVNQDEWEQIRDSNMADTSS